jgi:hypothetical protein
MSVSQPISLTGVKATGRMSARARAHVRTFLSSMSTSLPVFVTDMVANRKGAARAGADVRLLLSSLSRSQPVHPTGVASTGNIQVVKDCQLSAHFDVHSTAHPPNWYGC